MDTRAVQILWDSSQLWGALVWQAMRSFELPWRLLDAQKIAQGALLGKRLLIVPGGNARQKALALGERGRSAIREWVGSGGIYLGFCGGAGLALSHPQPGDCLGLCPWQRKAYTDRLCHLISGHVRAATGGRELELPVWWPGSFEAGSEPLDILATYQGPGPDLWLGDHPWPSSMPWLSLDLQPGQPLAVRGKYGKGAYILSYAHLETPASPAANSWLCALLAGFGISARRRIAGTWDTAPAPIPPSGSLQASLHACHAALQDLMLRWQAAGLFFSRTAWLMGWRRGLPGITLNHMRAGFAMLAELEPCERTHELWRAKGSEFMKLMDRFLNVSETFFLGFRCGGQTGARSREQAMLFGHPALGGGMAGDLLAFLEQLILSSQGRG